jgi:dethiobiotin synthetase
MIVEGAGGIMVPLADRYSYLDLAADIALPVLIIARPGLGTINHTLLTIQVLKQRNLKIAGIVINYAGDRRTGLAERTGPPEIERISGVSILGTLRYGSEEVEGIVDRILSPRMSGRRG